MVNHCIFSSVNTKVTVDIAEMSPFGLCFKLLQLCGWSGVKWLQVGEIREVVEQKGKKSQR